MLLAQVKGNFEFRSDAEVGKLRKLPSAIDSGSNNTLGSDAFQNIRILHVDDDAGLLTTTKQILELQNPFCVEFASSVREAQEKLEKKVLMMQFPCFQVQTVSLLLMAVLGYF